MREPASWREQRRLLDEIALDKYSFVRDAFLQRGVMQLVFDGNPPDETTCSTAAWSTSRRQMTDRVRPRLSPARYRAAPEPTTQSQR